MSPDATAATSAIGVTAIPAMHPSAANRGGGDSSCITGRGRRYLGSGMRVMGCCPLKRRFAADCGLGDYMLSAIALPTAAPIATRPPMPNPEIGTPILSLQLLRQNVRIRTNHAGTAACRAAIITLAASHTIRKGCWLRDAYTLRFCAFRRTA